MRQHNEFGFHWVTRCFFLHFRWTINHYIVMNRWTVNIYMYRIVVDFKTLLDIILQYFTNLATFHFRFTFSFSKFFLNICLTSFEVCDKCTTIWWCEHYAQRSMWFLWVDTVEWWPVFQCCPANVSNRQYSRRRSRRDSSDRNRNYYFALAQCIHRICHRWVLSDRKIVPIAINFRILTIFLCVSN